MRAFFAVEIIVGYCVYCREFYQKIFKDEAI
jgi:hypothetical protein